MTFGAFLEIEGIAGESLDEQYKDWIEITNYNFSGHQAISQSPRGATVGGVTLSYFSFSKHLDFASCKLFEANCTGETISQVILSLSRTTGDKLQFFQVTLEDVIVAGYAQSAGGNSPLEMVDLSYGRISMTYSQPYSDSSSGGNITSGWDSNNKKIYS